jgi:hypothetical protein
MTRFIGVVVLSLGIVVSAALPAQASAHKTYKPGEFCSARSLGKTTRDGKLTLVCKKVGSHDRWERK